MLLIPEIENFDLVKKRKKEKRRRRRWVLFKALLQERLSYSLYMYANSDPWCKLIIPESDLNSSKQTCLRQLDNNFGITFYLLRVQCKAHPYAGNRKRKHKFVPAFTLCDDGQKWITRFCPFIRVLRSWHAFVTMNI